MWESGSEGLETEREREITRSRGIVSQANSAPIAETVVTSQCGNYSHPWAGLQCVGKAWPSGHIRIYSCLRVKEVLWLKRGGNPEDKGFR